MADPHREEIAKLETLYANNPEGRVFTHLAEAYRKSGDLERAREILEEGLRRHSDYSSAHVVLGRVLNDMGQADGATAAFRRVLELDRHNLVALRSLGEIATDAGDTEDALHYYRELLSLDPSDERLRVSVRTLEEQLDAERAAAARPEPAPTPAGTADAPPEPSSGAGAPQPVTAGASSDDAPAEPLDASDAGMEVPGLMRGGWADQDEAVADGPAEVEVEAERSENWEEDVGIELEALPGDLGALGEDAGDAAAVPAGAADHDWSAASGRVEDTAAFDFPVGDLTLDAEPAAAQAEPEADDAEAEAVPMAGLDIDLGLIPEGGAPTPVPDEVVEEPAPWPAGDGTDTLAAETAPEAAPADPFASAGDEAPIDPFAPAATPAPAEAFGSDVDAYGADTARAPESGAEEERAELVTETMAELYFAQGFYERAAEVYRSLLRQRPEDGRLTARLAEAERMLVPPPAAEPPLAETPSAETGDVWLEGVESAWTGGGGVAGGETTPYAWAEPGAEEEPGGPAVRDYFRSLLSWRPGAGAAGADGAAAAGNGGAAWAAVEPEAPAAADDGVPELELSADMETDAADAGGAWGAAAVEPPGLPEAASAAGADDEAPNEDEDLEMFRSWLQSLKK